ncbi:putative integral membrane protein [Bernardetia litoralis DSM 6794]|uniref:Putative integral membrane protein n=1 Tax=Bernardetia litoralis (strain ATCC 23117 / DSM 6794 / NBRC 15988 / NCIMB 1366 / Fx l1 / Sio-4) TaxID=880071 RepID=I4AGU9_BERLS|nr:DUF819 family protein [Bernardetia litoralis]AFM03184.1 putative integral membrane protein [Bernardetia litoralis DSM 6794]
MNSPLFTNDAVILGVLMLVLAFVFSTSNSKNKFWQKFYTYCPALLLCYFIPALLNYPFHLISPEWFDEKILDLAASLNISIPEGSNFHDIKEILIQNNVDESQYKGLIKDSKLYHVASRYLLPVSLVLLCLSIDLKGVINLGWRAIVMFLAATLSIILGGGIALFLVHAISPETVAGMGDNAIWRGLATIAGSWIGGGANQAAMKEIYHPSGSLFGAMIVIDVVVANIWMGFLLYGANMSDKIDKILKADNSAITSLKKKMEDFQAKHARIPSTTDFFMILAVGFGATAAAHFFADIVTPFMESYKELLTRLKLTSLMSGFFWLVVFATTIGVLLSFTKLRNLEGAGASKIGSVCIYILVTTIGMHMNLAEIGQYLGLFFLGIIWMIIHVSILLFVAYLIKAPFFFVAVGSQANIGGAASAPVVASAFSTALAPVGVLLAVLGYALGTYGAIAAALFMQYVYAGG